MIDMTQAAHTMIRQAAAHDEVVVKGGFFADAHLNSAVNELTQAIDILGLDQAETILSPFSDKVRTEAARIVGLMRAAQPSV